MLTSFLAIVLITPPWALALTLLVPPRAGWSVHAVVALMLALLSHRALTRLLRLPLARARAGLHRLIPSRPMRPVFVAELGLAASLLALWQVQRPGAQDLVIGLGALGLGGLWMGAALRRGPEWGAGLELRGEALVLDSPRGAQELPLSGAVLREDEDGSLLLVAADGARALRVRPSPKASLYRVEDGDRLLEQLRQRLSGGPL